MNSSDSYKYWASNRGWISTKFAIKNPVTHFLNIYKKKMPQSKPQKTSQQSKKYFSASKRKIPTHQHQKIAHSDLKYSIQPTTTKPQTAPHNYTLNSCIILGQQIQQKSKTIHQPKRNKSLHVKKGKKLQEDIKGLREVNAVMTKIKQENETSHYSQKNFRATNCGRYKPQMMFLQPKFRASTASVKLKPSNKVHEQFQRRKTTIYDSINKSMEVDRRIRQYELGQQSTSPNQHQQIEYMTQYGYEQGPREDVRGGIGLVLGKQQQAQGLGLRKKPNLSVLRNKLNLHYKQSEYREKISSGMDAQTKDLSFETFD